jgi:hypothetical protein
MDIKDRIAAMGLGALTIDRLVRYGADGNGRHAHGFAVRCEDKTLADVWIKPGCEFPQEKADEFAQALFALLSGSEGRVLDREETIANLRAALERSRREVTRLKDALAHFERGRATRGSFYAAAEEIGAVWLIGQPSWSAFGLRFDSWHDLATALPGLRPCGVQAGEGRDAGTTFIVMRSVADLAPPAKTEG